MVSYSTGRKRRCGWLDVVVLKYSHMINGYSSINITKLDVLDELDTVKIGAAQVGWHGLVAPSGRSLAVPYM